MKLDRRTVLTGAAAAFAAPMIVSLPARADAKRQSLVDASLATGLKVLSGKDFPDAVKLMSEARGKVSEIVFIIRTAKGLAAILDHKFKFGAEAGVTMVAVGIGLEGASTAAGGADIVAFANSAGLFAGASIEGSFLEPDSDWNALYYGPGATAKAIAIERKVSNPGAEPLRKFLARW